RRAQQGFDLRFRQRLGEAARQPGRIDEQGRVDLDAALAHECTVEVPQGRQQPRVRARLVPAATLACVTAAQAEVVLQVGARGAFERASTAREPARPGLEVEAIARE